MRTDLTADQLKEFLRYDPATGKFLWIKTPFRKSQFLGKTAGCVASNGYISIKLLGTVHYAHRLAWLYMTGAWPPHHIDHRNTDRSDNRWNNIRKGGYGVNAQNRTANRGTRLGLKGVHYNDAVFRRKPFGAKIGLNGKTYRLGYFSTPEEAHEAYCRAAVKYYGEYARFA